MSKTIGCKIHWIKTCVITWWFIPLSKWVIPLVITGLSRARFTYNWGYNPLTNWDEPSSRGFAVYSLVASVVGSTGYFKFDSTLDSTHKTVGDVSDIDIFLCCRSLSCFQCLFTYSTRLIGVQLRYCLYSCPFLWFFMSICVYYRIFLAAKWRCISFFVLKYPFGLFML